MKIAILIFIIFVVIIIFRLINNFNKKNYLNKNEEGIIDLEKDPNSDDYKPKE